MTNLSSQPTSWPVGWSLAVNDASAIALTKLSRGWLASIVDVAKLVFVLLNFQAIKDLVVHKLSSTPSIDRQ